MALSLRSLSFGALARRSGVPDWPADVMASVIGDRVTETARSNRLASIIVPSIVTVAALIGAFLVGTGPWRTVLFGVAGLGALVVLVLWLLGTATVRTTEAFFTSPVVVPEGIAGRLLESAQIPEGRLAQLRFANALRTPQGMAALMDRVLDTVSALAVELGATPAQAAELHRFLADAVRHTPPA